MALVAVAARTRLLMAALHFDQIPSALEELCNELRIPALQDHAQLFKSPPYSAYSASATPSTGEGPLLLEIESVGLLRGLMLLQYLIARMLWDTRIGKRSSAVALLAAYLRLMEGGVLDNWAAQGHGAAVLVSTACQQDRRTLLMMACRSLVPVAAAGQLNF